MGVLLFYAPVDEILNELEDLHKSINEQAIHQIHSGEIILTTGRSKTVELFLKAAAAKKRDFSVMVCEGAPTNSGHEMALALAAAGIPTTVIHDAAVFAVQTNKRQEIQTGTTSKQTAQTRFVLSST